MRLTYPAGASQSLINLNTPATGVTHTVTPASG